MQLEKNAQIFTVSVEILKGTPVIVAQNGGRLLGQTETNFTTGSAVYSKSQLWFPTRKHATELRAPVSFHTTAFVYTVAEDVDAAKEWIREEYECLNQLRIKELNRLLESCVSMP